MLLSFLKIGLVILTQCLKYSLRRFLFGFDFFHPFFNGNKSPSTGVSPQQDFSCLLPPQCSR